MVFLSLTRKFGEGMNNPLGINYKNEIVYNNLVLPPKSAMIYETQYTEEFARAFCGSRTYCIPSILCGRSLPKGVEISSTEILNSYLFLAEDKDLPPIAKCVLVNKSDNEARVKIRVYEEDSFCLNLKKYLSEMNDFLNQVYSIEFLDDVNKYLFTRGKTLRTLGIFSVFPDTVFATSRDHKYDTVIAEFCLRNMMLKPGEELRLNCEHIKLGRVKEQAYYYFHNKKLYTDHCRYELILFFQLLILFRLHYALDKESNNCKTCGTYYLESIPDKDYISEMIKDEDGNLVMRIVNTSSKSFDLGYSCCLHSAGNIQEDLRDAQTIMNDLGFSTKQVIDYQEILTREAKEERTRNIVIFWVPLMIMILVMLIGLFMMRS